ncbi:MAG: NAD(P)/FAD-dependent oxidoreductase [Limnohabitans sp.]|jgi:glycine/D-amino acid oxidase-like deaminating enzyme
MKQTGMPFSQALPDLPLQSPRGSLNVWVVGSGAVGLSCALWLLKSGHHVTVFDPNPPLEDIDYRGACSFGNACSIAYGAVTPVAMPGILKDVPSMLTNPLAHLSIQWRNFPELIPWLLQFIRASKTEKVLEIVQELTELLRLAEAGISPLLQESGSQNLIRNRECLYLYHSKEKYQQAQYGLQLRANQGVRMETLTASQVYEREPHLTPVYHKGVLFLDAYSLESPYVYMKNLAKCILQRGGKFVRQNIDDIVTVNDQVRLKGQGVLSEPADQVVLAAGAWSKKLLHPKDQVLLNTERGYHVMFPGAEKLLTTPTCYPEHGFYMTPMMDGVRAAGTVELGGLGRAPNPKRIEVIERATRQLIQGLGSSGDTWLGHRPSMPDSLPVIGPSPHNERIIYAFGHGHLGLTLAGITGRLVAEISGGHSLSKNIHALRPLRF